MPIIVDNKALKAAADSYPNGETLAQKAILIGAHPRTLTKIYEGHTDLQLNKAEKIADKFGLDVHVTFRKRRPAKAEAGA